jgi:hypothetical protein
MVGTPTSSAGTPASEDELLQKFQEMSDDDFALDPEIDGIFNNVRSLVNAVLKVHTKDIPSTVSLPYGLSRDLDGGEFYIHDFAPNNEVYNAVRFTLDNLTGAAREKILFVLRKELKMPATPTPDPAKVVSGIGGGGVIPPIVDATKKSTSTEKRTWIEWLTDDDPKTTWVGYANQKLEAGFFGNFNIFGENFILRKLFDQQKKG